MLYPQPLSKKLVPDFSLKIISKQPPAVLVVMTINAEVFPVRAIRGIVLVIPVFMMYCKKIPVFEIKLSPAFSAKQSVDFQGLFPVI
jgi:hypothetical protein